MKALLVVLLFDIESFCRQSKGKQRHCVDTEKSLCTQGISNPELEYSSTLSVFVLVNSKALTQGRNFCVDTGSTK